MPRRYSNIEIDDTPTFQLRLLRQSPRPTRAVGMFADGIWPSECEKILVHKSLEHIHMPQGIMRGMLPSAASQQQQQLWVRQAE